MLYVQRLTQRYSLPVGVVDDEKIFMVDLLGAVASMTQLIIENSTKNMAYDILAGEIPIAEEGDVIRVSIAVRNDGQGAGDIFYKIIDRDTSEELASKTQTLPEGSSLTDYPLIGYMPNHDWNLSAQAGH